MMAQDDILDGMFAEAAAQQPVRTGGNDHLAGQRQRLQPCGQVGRGGTERAAGARGGQRQPWHHRPDHSAGHLAERGPAGVMGHRSVG